MPSASAATPPPISIVPKVKTNTPTKTVELTAEDKPIEKDHKNLDSMAKTEAVGKFHKTKLDSCINFIDVLLELQPQSVNSHAVITVSVILFIVIMVVTIIASLVTWVLW